MVTISNMIFILILEKKYVFSFILKPLNWFLRFFGTCTGTLSTITQHIPGFQMILPSYIFVKYISFFSILKNHSQNLFILILQNISENNCPYQNYNIQDMLEHNSLSLVEHIHRKYKILIFKDNLSVSDKKSAWEG